MREVLFRGKRAVNGNWAEGYYSKGFLFPEEETLRDFIYVFSEESGKWEFDYAMVDPETVSQYTGLCDKNGKKIFEGDILPIWENGEEYNYKVFYNADCFMLAMLDSAQGSYPLSIKHNQTEVIGNIYDNPEMLGGRS